MKAGISKHENLTEKSDSFGEKASSMEMFDAQKADVTFLISHRQDLSLIHLTLCSVQLRFAARFKIERDNAKCRSTWTNFCTIA